MSTTKFKVGDRVTHDANADVLGFEGFDGKIATVVKADGDGGYLTYEVVFDEGNGKGSWPMCERELTLVTQHPLITKGDGTNGTIYERLRKRSYRRMHAAGVEWDAWFEDDAFTQPPTDSYNNATHAAYIAGVRDALQANEAYVGEVA